MTKTADKICGTFLKIGGGEGGSRENYITRVKGKYMRLEMDTYLDVDVGRVADKSGPAEEYLRGWWCVVQRRLIRLCEGEPSAARLYKPARLCDSRTPSHPMHGPHPRGWFPPRRRFAAKAFSSNQTYLGHVPPAPVHRRQPTILCELESRRRSADGEAVAGISGYGCIPQVLAPENFRARGVRFLIDYIRLAAIQPAKRQMDP